MWCNITKDKKLQLSVCLVIVRVFEHASDHDNVAQALPPTVESRAEVKRLNQQLTGAFYDAEYGLE